MSRAHGQYGEGSASPPAALLHQRPAGGVSSLVCPESYGTVSLLSLGNPGSYGTVSPLSLGNPGSYGTVSLLSLGNPGSYGTVSRLDPPSSAAATFAAKARTKRAIATARMSRVRSGFTCVSFVALPRSADCAR